MSATAIAQSGKGPPKKARAGNRSKKILNKTVAIFQCTGETCQKIWQSAHAWASRRVLCEICNSKAKVEEIREEMCDLDTYNCNCGETWQAIHDTNPDAEQQQQCYECNEMVTKNDGFQTRFGCHFWLRCLNADNCGVEWEDFALGHNYGQRCRSCYNQGKIVRILRTARTPAAEGSNNGGGGGGGRHNADYCDMCMKLRSEGKPGSCMRWKKIQFAITERDGVIHETIAKCSR